MLSVSDFFQNLDFSIPGLNEVHLATNKKDWIGAQKALAAYFKARQEPAWFSDEVVLDVWDEFSLAKADEIVHNKLVSCGIQHDFGDQIDWELSQPYSPKWTWRLSRHLYWVQLGQAYKQTLDEKYAQAFVYQLNHWCENVICPSNTNGLVWDNGAEMMTGRTNGWRTLECAYRILHSWTWSFHFFMQSPSFNFKTICTMLQSLMEQVLHITRWSQEGSQWRGTESCAVFFLGVLFPEFKDAEKWRALGLDRIMRFFYQQIYPDGAVVDLSSSIHHLQSFFLALELGQLNNVKIPEDFLSMLKNIFNHRLSLSMPDQTLPSLNDGGRVKIQRIFEQAHALFPERSDFQWIATQGEQGCLPNMDSCAFPYAGHFVMKASNEDGDLYLFFDGGPLGNLHGHEDKLNIIVYAYNQLHLVDSGACSYDAPMEWRRYFSSTQAHNTTAIDGLGQSRLESIVRQPIPIKKTPHIWISEDDFDFVSASYNEGYGSERLNVIHRRSILFFKPYFWVVIDSLAPQDSSLHHYETFFHLDSSQVNQDSKGIETQNMSGSNLGVYGFEDMEISVLSGQKKPAIQGWMINEEPEDYQPCPTAVFHKSEVGPVTNAYMIYPMPEKSPSRIRSAKRLNNGPTSEDEFQGKIELLDGKKVVITHKCGLNEPEIMGLLVDNDGRVEKIYLVNKQAAMLDGNLVRKNSKLDV